MIPIFAVHSCLLSPGMRFRRDGLYYSHHFHAVSPRNAFYSMMPNLTGDSQAPTTVFSVEILGSWDNFSKPYQLKRDRRTGPGQWRGCHTFENITCDGDTLLNASTSRDGGLKMGGTYWYYVRLFRAKTSSLFQLSSCIVRPRW